MILKMLSVYDSKAKVWSHPFFSVTTGAGVRSFQSAINARESLLFSHSADFTLFELGVFDDNLGVVEMHQAAVNLGIGSSFKEESYANAPVGNEAHVQPGAAGGNSAKHV